MTNIKPQTLKGFRDFLPKEARKRQYVINALKEVFELYGFEPLETPALEYEEVLLGKYGEEGDKLMYRFTDRGGRKVALRYDQTVPLARAVSQYGSASSPQVLPMPFKRYQIQPVWRAENPQKGRFREFLQCDIDTVGTTSPLADAEIIATAAKSLENLGINKFKILFNSREILSNLAKQARIPEDKWFPAFQILDKKNKVKSVDELKNEWIARGIDPKSFDVMEELISNLSLIWRTKTKTNTALDDIYRNTISLGVNSKNLQFMPSVVRGLDYYTGMIFEVEIEGYSGGSVGGGGRYDNLIGLFSGKPIPAVGFSFGFDRLVEAMDQLNLFPQNITPSTTKVLVTIFSPELLPKSLETTLLLRRNRVNAEIYLPAGRQGLNEGTPLDKQLKYADQKGIPYVAIIGPEEAAKQTVKLKTMATGAQEEISQDNLIKKLRNLEAL